MTIDDLELIDKCGTQCYISNSIQLTHIIRWVLSQIGPADIRVTSFSISEEFLRSLALLKVNNSIKSLTLVLDSKALLKTVKLWNFIANVADEVYLANTHAKILLMENVNHSIAVLTSQNLTRGGRYESTIISNDQKIYRKLFNQLSDIINSNSRKFDGTNG